MASESHLTRREILKRGGLLTGAVLWTTPAVQIVGTSRALAQETSPVSPPDGPTGACGGTVVDASTGAAIPGAQVSVVGLGISTTTDSSGAFLLTGIPEGPQQLETSAPGYITDTTGIVIVADTTGDKLIALSAVSSEQVTAVLTWGSTPSDLDLHASGPNGSGGRFHAYYANPTPADHVELDLDDQDSFGPETMAFKISPSAGGVFIAGTYRVWVHDYTNRLGTPQWDESGAQVAFNGLAGQIASYSVNTAIADQGGAVGPDDDLWRVVQFDLDAVGTVSNIVVFQDFILGDQTTPDIV